MAISLKLQSSSKNDLIHWAFWTGFTALVYEIYAVKILFLFFYESIHAATIAIASFLAGLACSALFFPALVPKEENGAWKILILLQFLLAVYVFGVLIHYERVPVVFDVFYRWFHALPDLAYAAKVIFAAGYLFVPAFLMGGVFPILNGLYMQREGTNARNAGRIYFFDLVGSVTGALTAGFVLIPLLGLDNTLALPVLINLALLISSLSAGRFARIVLFVIVEILALSIFIFPARGVFISQRSAHAGLIHQKSLLKEYDKRFGQILFQKNSPFGIVTVGENVSGFQGVRSLFINYRDMCGFQYLDEQKVGSVAVENMPAKSHVLNIGLGCGIMAGAILSDPQVARLDVVEINPVVVDAAGYFTKENRNMLQDKRAKVIADDGAEFVRHTAEHYDAILVDVEEPSIVHSSPLFTLDFFENYRKLLNKNGVLTLWVVHSPEAAAKILWNTLARAFPHVRLRILPGGHYQFQASVDRVLPFQYSSEKERVKLEKIRRYPSDAVNTIANRALEKYVNVRDIFSIPEPVLDKDV